MFNSEAKVEIEMHKIEFTLQMLNYFKKFRFQYSLKTPDFTFNKALKI